ncbi:MAG: high frequency lysogenization protein HflD [Amylibacter sp.]|nr:high frequency lysogenization protein HflD [Amylibacter sp.]
MFSIWILGFVVGLGHAFEPDHMAAVSTLISDKSSRRDIIRHGAIWGFGHTLVLLLVGGTALLLKKTLPVQFAVGLEMLVGVMLIGLGAHVLYRLRRDKVHFHRHSHQDGVQHIHIHSHQHDTTPHTPEKHRHAHPDRSALRTLMVGLMHGLAGSAAIILTTAATLNSTPLGLVYIVVFGAGSIIGMACVTLLMSLVLIPARALTRLNNGLHYFIGAATISVGFYVLVTSGALLDITL